MKRLDLILQTENINDLICKLIDYRCEYCPQHEVENCDRCCSTHVVEYLNQEMVIDFDEIVQTIHCNEVGCERCILENKKNCKTLYLWSTFGKVL